MKYRKGVIPQEIGEALKEVCFEISERYEIHFVEIGYETGHIHFLVQSVPKLSVSEIARTIKSITAKQLYQRHPEILTKSWEVIFGQADSTF